MVKIIYYADPTKDGEVFECDNITSFIQPRFKTRDELLDLRFFDTDILGHEIDQSGGDFLDINEGTVAITHNSMIPRDPATIWYVVVAVTAAVAVTLLAPTAEIPKVQGRDQQSGTNRLGDSTNEPRVNERIDDIFGTVNKHVPPLWQVPYRIGVNNEEVEVLLLCVGRGKYQINTNEWFDGDTPVIDIPNASVNIFEPFKDPNTDAPDIVIGDVIDREIGVYRQSNDLNPSELLPPNALETSAITWSATGSGANGLLSADTLPDGFLLTDNYSVGDKVKLFEMNYLKPDGSSITLTREFTTPSSTVSFLTYEPPVDLGEDGELEYEILNVTSDTLTLKIPLDASPEVVTAWGEMNAYSIPDFAAEIVAPTIPADTYVISNTIIVDSWVVSDGETTFNVVVEFNYYGIAVGAEFDNLVGPIFVPQNAAKALLNFTSDNGYYKLVKNSEIAIYSVIQITIFELDANNEQTGVKTVLQRSYVTNPVEITNAVFQTYEFDLPYTRNAISCERLSNRDKREEVSNVDIIQWRDLYTFEPVEAGDFGDVTVAHVYIPSNSQSRLIKQRKQNLNLTRLITEYQGNGVFGPAESYPTNDFSKILIHTALDPYIGRLSIENINADGYLDIRDEIIDYFGSSVMTEFGYDFDSVNMTFQDTFMLIANVVMCTAYAQRGVYDIFFEKKQTVSSMQITCRNKKMDSETRKITYDRKYDGVELTYRDNETGTSNTIYIPSDQSSRNPERINLPGCVNEIQATRYGYRVYNRQKYQIESVQFDVDEFGRNIIPNKRIDSPDSTRFTRREGATDGYRVFDGEVVEVDGMNVELSEPVVFEDGEDHYITFSTSNGDNSEVILCTQVDDFTVLLNTLPSEPIYDGYEKDRTKFMLVSEQLKESVALIPKTIEFNLDDDGVETHTINSVNYTDKYYQNDLDTLE